MTVTHAAVSALIKASRKASRLSDVFSDELSNGAATVMDEISGHILDALISMHGDPPVDLDQSETVRIVRDPSSPPDIAATKLIG